MTDPTFMGRYLRGSWTRHVPTKAGHRTLTRTSRLLRKAHKSRAACPLPQPSGRGASPGGAAPFILCLQPLETLLSCQDDSPETPHRWKTRVSWHDDKGGGPRVDKAGAFSCLHDG